MRDFCVRRSRQLLPWVAAGVFLGGMLARPAIASGAAVDTPPDPAGIATGDKSTAVDAAGNPFVVPEPTDQADPDYAAKKKAFDDYQAQAAKEPLAVNWQTRSGTSGLRPTWGGPLIPGTSCCSCKRGSPC